jgi:hypothetical protein
MKHVPFSSTTALTFLKAKIKAGPLTMLNKTADITRLGLAGNNHYTDCRPDKRPHLFDSGPCVVSVSIVHLLCSLHLPIYHYLQSEAGCRVLVNIILLHVVSKIGGTEVDVGIVPEFRMDATRFEYAATSYGGVVDYLTVRGPPAAISLYTIRL